MYASPSSAGWSHEELLGKLKWLMLIRLLLVALLIGFLAFLHLRYGEQTLYHPSKILTLSVIVLLATGVYYLLFRGGWHPRAQAYLQMTGDVCFVTLLLLVSGGVQSAFPPIYNLPVLASALLLFRRGAFLVAGLSAILYGGLANLQYYGFLRGIAGAWPEGEGVLYALFLNILTFFVIGYLGSELSERLIRVSRRLEERQDRLLDLQVFSNEVIQSMSSGLFTTDLEGRMTSVNPAAEAITGQPALGVLGKSVTKVFPFPVIQETAGRMASGVFPPRRFEAETTRREGGRLILGMTLSPFKDREGRVKGMIGIFQDLTRLMEMEEEIKRKDRLAALGEMAAGVAHEIRNPLASLSGSIEVLKGERSLDDEGRRLMEIVLRETDRLNQIVSDFLTFARPKPPQRTQCRIETLLEETLELIRKRPECQVGIDSYRDGIKIVTQFQEQPAGVEVCVDPHQMRQVFWNLAINALASMPDGGTLTVTTEYRNPKSNSLNPPLISPSLFPSPLAGEGRVGVTGGKGGFDVRPRLPVPMESGTAGRAGTSDSGSSVKIVFSDTGEGIDRKHLGRVFNPFYTTRPGGTGLGLAVVDRILEAHDGS
ncbi:MAG: PAS domain S-box protein, partial [Nitrospirae bacterium]|nr:PAS domain S-box protein [Nitrospirota bacterium]